MTNHAEPIWVHPCQAPKRMVKSSLILELRMIAAGTLNRRSLRGVRLLPKGT